MSIFFHPSDEDLSPGPPVSREIDSAVAVPVYNLSEKC
jgi:hypothetical protein